MRKLGKQPQSARTPLNLRPSEADYADWASGVNPAAAWTCADDIEAGFAKQLADASQ